MTLANILRIYCIFQGTLTMGLAFATLYYYLRILLSHKLKELVMPSHVIPLAISHIGLTLFALNSIREHLTTNSLTWRTPFLISMFFLSDFGLWLISSYEFKRFQIGRKIQKKIEIES